jgi:hypothetical protein
MQILNQKQKQARVKLPNPIASLPTPVPNWK